MPLSFLRYKLVNGFITNWLVAGPQSLQIPEANKKHSLSEIAQTFYSTDSGISQLPVERGPLNEGIFQIDDYLGSWKYYHCSEDRFIDFSSRGQSPFYLRSWAYTQLKSMSVCDVFLTVTTFGPVDLWLNDTHIQRVEGFSSKSPTHNRIPVRFTKGSNFLLLRFEQVGLGNRPYAGAVSILKNTQQLDPVSDIRVLIPTTISHLARRNELEHAFSHAFVRRDIFSLEDNNQNNVEVEWPKKVDQHAITFVRLQTPSGQIYAQSEEKGKPEDKASLGYVGSLQEGAYEIALTPSPREYYEENIRVDRTIPVWVTGNQAYSKSAYGNFQSRKLEALVEASRRTGQLHAEIAKMALNHWGNVSTTVLLKSIKQISQIPDSFLDLLTLLGMVYRFDKREGFPLEVSSALEKCIIHFPFTQEILDELSEAEQILAYACKILAGQKFPRKTFSALGVKGNQLREQGEKSSIEWLYQKSTTGFNVWDSDEQLAHIIVALSHVIDLAEMDNVFNLAAVLLDKILIGMAINSYQGVLASSNGQGTGLGVNSALTKATAGISRIYWGQGVFNHHISVYVSVACMENYEMPSVIEDIARSQDEIYGKERHAGTSKVNYRTRDFMLSSALNYRIGDRGAKEQVWQATLSPEAIVYVNHPGSSATNDSLAPNFWLGNAVLPRVAQYKDVLLSIHNLPVDDWMGYTHAYFPAFAFDEYNISKNWGFARKGDGYLAITASDNMNFVEKGIGAYRELRCNGLKTIWICQLGSRGADGDFQEFRRKILKLAVAFQDFAVNFHSLRGDDLYLNWDGKFLINHNEQPISSELHYDYPFVKSEYPCHKMEVEYNNYILRLNFQPDGK